MVSEPLACRPTTTGSSCVHLTSRRICRQWGQAEDGTRASHGAVLTEAGDTVHLPCELNLHGLAQACRGSTGRGPHCCATDWGSQWTPDGLEEASADRAQSSWPLLGSPTPHLGLQLPAAALSDVDSPLQQLQAVS